MHDVLHEVELVHDDRHDGQDPGVHCPHDPGDPASLAGTRHYVVGGGQPKGLHLSLLSEKVKYISHLFRSSVRCEELLDGIQGLDPRLCHGQPQEVLVVEVGVVEVVPPGQQRDGRDVRRGSPGEGNVGVLMSM